MRGAVNDVQTYIIIEKTLLQKMEREETIKEGYFAVENASSSSHETGWRLLIQHIFS